MQRAVIQKTWWWWAVAILVVAALLRFYQLGQVPHGLAWDEAAIGYNGYAVITKRRDEWLERLPVSFRSFGDYKAPLAIYLNGVFTYFLGMEVWVVRLPFAIAGVAAVTAWMLLISRWWPTEMKLAKPTAILLGGGLLAFSPWHLHYSRVAFESGLALSFLLWGMVGLSWLINPWPSKTSSWQKRQQWLAATLTLLGLVASIYTYHSSKIVVPLLVGLTLCLSWRSYLRKAIWILGIGVLSLAALFPLVRDTLMGSGGERFAQASMFAKGWPVSEVVAKLWSHALIHLSPQFLVAGATPTLRHGDGQWGVLFPLELVAVVLGIVAGMKWLPARRWWGVMLGWVVIGLVPAIIGIDVPHSNRSLLALPGFLGLALIGIDRTMRWLDEMPNRPNWRGSHGEQNLLKPMVIGLSILVSGFIFLSYLRHYYTVFARESAAAFSDGYIEAFKYVVPFEKGSDGLPEASKIIFSSRYGQPYIYALFVRKTNPIYYQGGSLIKYEFSDHINIGDLDRKQTVVVATPEDELPPERANYVVYGSDAKPRFYIYDPHP